MAHSHFSTSYTAHRYAISLFPGFFKPIYLLNANLFISWACDPLFLPLGTDGFVTCLPTLCCPCCWAFFLPLGSSKMTLNIYSLKHMKHSCSSYVNKRPSCLSYFSSFFSFVGFFKQWTFFYIYIYIYTFFSCREQCCLFEFPSLAVILKYIRRFINFIPILMAGPSPTFMPALMT